MKTLLIALALLALQGCAGTQQVLHDYYQYRSSEQGQLDALRYDIRQMKHEQAQRDMYRPLFGGAQ